jgi:hypothetical protein
MTPATSEDYGHSLSSTAINATRLSAKELSCQQKENGFKKCRLEIEKKEIALQRQAQDLDLEKRTLQNDEQAFALKKEKAKQNQQSPAALLPRRATAKSTSRGGNRSGATKKGAAGRSESKPGPKPKPKGKLRLSGNTIKAEDDEEEDDDDYRVPMTKKRGRTAVLDGDDTIVDTKSEAEQVLEGETIYHG